MTKAELERELRATRRALRETRRTLQRSEDERAKLLETVHVLARSTASAPLGVRAFALAIGEPSFADVSRFLTGKLGARARDRVRPKVETWLASKFTDSAPEHSLESIRTLSDGSLLDLLFWSRAVERPAGAAIRKTTRGASVGP